MLSSLTGKKTMGIIKMSFKSIRFCTSGSVVEYRLAKARVAGSNPVSCFIVKCAGAFIYKGFRLFSITIVKGRVG